VAVVEGGSGWQWEWLTVVGWQWREKLGGSGLKWQWIAVAGRQWSAVDRWLWLRVAVVDC
jgi:hypothetical protein